MNSACQACSVMTQVQLVGRVGAAGEVLHDGLEPGMGHEVLAQRLELGAAHRLVVVPPDGVFGGLVTHHELVVGAPAGVLAGGDDEAATFRHEAFATGNGLLVQHGSRRVPRDLVQPGHAEIGKLGAG